VTSAEDDEGGSTGAGEEALGVWLRVAVGVCIGVHRALSSSATPVPA
jgi:hypothetical protein